MNVVADKSSTGLDANIAGALAYIPVVAIAFLVVEKSSRFVKFHAVQSLLLCAASDLDPAIAVQLGALQTAGARGARPSTRRSSGCSPARC